MTNDPFHQTRGDSTPFIGDAQTVSLSRNEVSALCTKAARGTGMDWDLAEEAGFAAAWLVQHGFDGPKHLYTHLAQAQGRPWADLCPTAALGDWHAPDRQSLCPIALGMTLSDYAALPEGAVDGCSIRIGPVDHPVLLIPFLATIAQSTNTLFTLEWNGGSALIGGNRVALIAAVKTLADHCGPLCLTARSGVAKPVIAAEAPDTDANIITALNALAMRTTVASSDASRAGVGSTSNDND